MTSYAGVDALAGRCAQLRDVTESTSLPPERGGGCPR